MSMSMLVVEPVLINGLLAILVEWILTTAISRVLTELNVVISVLAVVVERLWCDRSERSLG